MERLLRHPCASPAYPRSVHGGADMLETRPTETASEHASVRKCHTAISENASPSSAASS